ncbi:MAG: LacI family DNA-binding transcriptional regulator [Flavobacteriaceae bacterium]|nr:LacI family DNA-binding transcriptional regulator [Flavobacteriaceae bacterium]
MKRTETPIKIKDIAKIAQVSTGTIDRVLHNRSDVSEKTREKILKIIDKHGYKTNIIAKTLASKSQIIFSILIPKYDTFSNYWQKPLFGIQKAEEELSNYSIKITKYFFDLSDANSFKRASKRLINSNPNAVVMAPVFKKEALAFADKLTQKKVPFVLLDSNLDENQGSIGYVGHNSYQSGIVAAKLIYTRINDTGNILLINLLSNSKNQNHLSQRSDGFRSFFKDKNRNGNIVELDIYDLGEMEIFSNFTNIFKDISNIQAIFVTNSKVHIIAKYLLNYQSDQNIILVGFDLIEQNISYLKNETIDYLISQNPIEQGYQSIMKLFQTTILKETSNKITYLPIDIIIKENLGYK